MKVFKPPLYVPNHGLQHSIFLAGSINLGKAIEWQMQVEAALTTVDSLAVFNPRRDDFDVTWPQDANHEGFSEQVSWELAHLESADLIMMYLDDTGMAPISMLELGLYATSGKLMVARSDGYARKGNVDIVCERYGVKIYDNLEAMIEAAKNWFIKDKLFPDRLQGHGFPTERAAIRAAREHLGTAASRDYAFTITSEGDKWSWINVSTPQYEKALRTGF